MIIEQQEFIKHTLRYLELARTEEIVIIFKDKPMLALHASFPIRRASHLAGIAKIDINEDDINSHVLAPLE